MKQISISTKLRRKLKISAYLVAMDCHVARETAVGTSDGGDKTDDTSESMVPDLILHAFEGDMAAGRFPLPDDDRTPSLVMPLRALS